MYNTFGIFWYSTIDNFKVNHYYQSYEQYNGSFHCDDAAAQKGLMHQTMQDIILIERGNWQITIKHTILITTGMMITPFHVNDESSIKFHHFQQLDIVLTRKKTLT